MKIHYYLDWYNDSFPEKLAKVLNEDITERKSLVMISADPFFYEEAEIGVTERGWLDKANIAFEAYHLIDYNIQKEEAKKLIQDASVIFLLGGYTVEQNTLLIQYELIDLIKETEAVVMGTSAGAINMTAKWICSKYNGDNVEESVIYDGIGLNPFSFQPHLDFNNAQLIQGELFPLSEEMNLYMADQGAVRVKGNKTDILGNIYLIAHSKVHKLEETL